MSQTITSIGNALKARQDHHPAQRPGRGGERALPRHAGARLRALQRGRRFTRCEPHARICGICRSPSPGLAKLARPSCRCAFAHRGAVAAHVEPGANGAVARAQLLLSASPDLLLGMESTQAAQYSWLAAAKPELAAPRRPPPFRPEHHRIARRQTCASRLVVPGGVTSRYRRQAQ